MCNVNYCSTGRARYICDVLFRSSDYFYVMTWPWMLWSQNRFERSICRITLNQSMKTSKLNVRKEPPGAESLDVYFVTFRYKIADSHFTTKVSPGAVSNPSKLAQPSYILFIFMEPFGSFLDVRRTRSLFHSRDSSRGSRDKHARRGNPKSEIATISINLCRLRRWRIVKRMCN